MTPESVPVRFALLGGAVPVAETGGFLVSARIIVEPETRLDHDHFGTAAVLSVETGSLDVIVGAGTVRIAGADGEPWDPARTLLAPGRVHTLHVGDWVAFDRGAELTVRNRGDQPTVILVAAFVTAPVKL